MIIETTDNRFYQVRDSAHFDHLMLANQVKLTKGQWVLTAKAIALQAKNRLDYVSKAHIHRVVEA